MKYRFNFERPENYPDPTENCVGLLKELHAKIGQEQLEMRLDSILLEWAQQSGYFYMRSGNEMFFKSFSFYDPLTKGVA